MCTGFLAVGSLAAQQTTDTLWTRRSPTGTAALVMTYNQANGMVTALELSQRGFENHDFQITITPDGDTPRTVQQRGGLLVLNPNDLTYRELDPDESPFPPGTRVRNFSTTIIVTLPREFRGRGR